MELAYSGQLDDSAQVSTERTFYRSATLIAGADAKARITIHNCSASGTPSTDNMVGEVSTPATDGAQETDDPGGLIECPDGIRVVKVSGTIKYHVRYAAQPG